VNSNFITHASKGFHEVTHSIANNRDFLCTEFDGTICLASLAIVVSTCSDHDQGWMIGVANNAGRLGPPVFRDAIGSRFGSCTLCFRIVLLKSLWTTLGLHIIICDVCHVFFKIKQKLFANVRKRLLNDINV